MKLNDIYTNFKKTLNLKNSKRVLKVEDLNKQTIDSLRTKLDNIKIQEKRELKINYKKEKQID
jgi:hypothetical protein